MSTKRKRNVSKNSKFAQISTLIVLICLTSTFALMHKFKVEMPEVRKIIYIEPTPMGSITPVDPEPVPKRSPVPPIDLNSEIVADPDDIFKLDGFDDPVFEEPPDITFKGEINPDDVVPFYKVQEKPELSRVERKKLAGYISKNYPVLAKRSGLSGSVVLKFTCSKEGYPINIRIMSEEPVNMGFGEIAVKALKQVRFTPGMQRDRTVNVSMSFPIKFTTRK